jgi:hypothetical protein
VFSASPRAADSTRWAGAGPRRTEGQRSVLAATKALTDDRGDLTFDNGVAWLPSDDPYRPGARRVGRGGP